MSFSIPDISNDSRDWTFVGLCFFWWKVAAGSHTRCCTRSHMDILRKQRKNMLTFLVDEKIRDDLDRLLFPFWIPSISAFLLDGAVQRLPVPWKATTRGSTARIWKKLCLKTWLGTVRRERMDWIITMDRLGMKGRPSSCPVSPSWVKVGRWQLCFNLCNRSMETVRTIPQLSVAFHNIWWRSIKKHSLT